MLKYLHERLKKSGGWHHSAKFYAQDKCGRVCAYSEMPVVQNDWFTANNMLGYENNMDFYLPRNPDWKDNVVSYEMYLQYCAKKSLGF